MVQLDELARDGEAEPRAMVSPRRGRVHLRELAEHELVVLGRDADARVAHLDENRRLWLVRCHRRPHPHAAAGRGEVDRVRQEVAEDVSDLVAVGAHAGQVRCDIDREEQRPLGDERSVERRHLRDQLIHGEIAVRRRELVRRAARVREDVADHVQQLPAAADHADDALALPRVELAEDPIAQDLGVRDDGRQRRAQVVRDVREELRLQRIFVPQLRDFARELKMLLLELGQTLLNGARVELRLIAER